MSEDTLDIAIVGGGVSGCYAAYRLLTADDETHVLRKRFGRGSLSVALFEASDRLGGRLWSYRFPDLPNQVAEMGGIGFSALYENVHGLCTKELDLKIENAQEFNISNFEYLRAHRFAFDDYRPKRRPKGYYPGTVPYFLRREEKWQLPTDLMLSAYKNAVAAPEVGYLLDELSRTGDDPEKARQIIRKLDVTLRNTRSTGTNLPLYDCGFWNLLAQHASQEAYDMATASLGLYSNTQNWNAYNTLLSTFLDFSVQQTWKKLQNGYDALPIEMARRFAGLGGKICKGTRLCGLGVEERNSEAVITMQFQRPEGVTSTERARNVILAIPPRSVWLLDPDTFLFRSQRFVDDLSTVTCEPASKLFLTFKEPWWKKVASHPWEPWWKKVASHPCQPKKTIENGQTATDLPMRLCYYLGSEAENGKSLLLASFCDSIAVDYWNGYFPRGQIGPSHRARQATQSHATALLRDPPAAMLQDAVRQLTLVHDFDVPEPLCAKFVNWSADPYGGGVHFWNTHVRSWEVMPRIRRPLSTANVFLCGEAFSAKQGSVEGAINTTERTLETYFGLLRPRWVPGDYDFGP